MSNIQINDCVYNGYLCHMVRKHGQNGQKGYYVHRFVYECFMV